MSCEHAAVPLSHVENYRRWVVAMSGAHPSQAGPVVR
jgi:hypothetical protein